MITLGLKYKHKESVRKFLANRNAFREVRTGNGRQYDTYFGRLLSLFFLKFAIMFVIHVGIFLFLLGCEH